MKNELVKPFELTKQQAEYVLAGYAAFQDAETIFEEFKACFPESVIAFEYDSPPGEWQKRLQLAIQLLYPGHPNFPKELNILFSGMRRSYLSTIEESRLGSARVRLDIMDKTIKELDEYREKYKDVETVVACQKLKLEVLKAAKTESYAFAESKTGRHGLSQEEIERLMAQLSDSQLAEFKERYAAGEFPDMIIADMMRANPDENVEVIDAEESEVQAEQATEQPQEEENDG